MWLILQCALCMLAKRDQLTLNGAGSGVIAMELIHLDPDNGTIFTHLVNYISLIVLVVNLSIPIVPTVAKCEFFNAAGSLKDRITIGITTGAVYLKTI